LLTGALAFAREVSGKPVPKTRERNEKLGAAEQNASIFAAARETARKKQRGMMAPLAAIDAVNPRRNCLSTKAARSSRSYLPNASFPINRRH